MNSLSKDSKKAQTNVVSAVIITGIIAVGILAAYTWGMPMLQKRRDMSKIDRAVSDLKGLASDIETIASQGGGRGISITVDGKLEVNPKNETIKYTTVSSAAYISTGEWITLRENDMLGVPGISPKGYGIMELDKPGVLIAKSKEYGSDFKVIFKLAFRELLDQDSQESYQIDLVDNGNLNVQSGSHTVRIESGGKKVEDQVTKKKILIKIE